MKKFTKELEAKLRKLRVYTKAYRNTTYYNGFEHYCISGCFAWDETPEGLNFWSDIDDKIEDMTTPYKNIIGGELL